MEASSSTDSTTRSYSTGAGKYFYQDDAPKGREPLYAVRDVHAAMYAFSAHRRSS
ncbi:MAG: hypothetical protein WKH64_07590 [Chloroflexia bacterium]